MTALGNRTITTPDIIISGAGYVGLAVAVALKQAAPGLSILLVDAAPAGVWRKDGRASAIAAGGVRMLQALGAWDGIAAQAQPITEMIVTDSRASDPVRPVFLTFDGDVKPGEPFAHMVPNLAMTTALRAIGEAIGVDIREGVAVSGFSRAGGETRLQTTQGETLTCRLAIACDGVNSTLRDKAGVRAHRFDYDQAGIVGTVYHERPHGGRAEEHFLPAGPFAILPLAPDAKGNRSSIVWVETRKDAERLCKEDAFIFEAELEMRFGHKLGPIRFEGTPKAYPLGLTLVRDFVIEGLALAGDAAHGIHPIAGQGLNLGLKDAAALAEVLVDAHRLGQDIGALDVLERYQQWRRFDTVRMGITTDVLTRLFSNDIGPLRALRSFGLGLVDRMPKMKDYFIAQASGLQKAGPKLLAGEMI